MTIRRHLVARSVSTHWPSRPELPEAVLIFTDVRALAVALPLDTRHLYTPESSMEAPEMMSSPATTRVLPSDTKRLLTLYHSTEGGGKPEPWQRSLMTSPCRYITLCFWIEASIDSLILSWMSRLTACEMPFSAEQVYTPVSRGVTLPMMSVPFSNTRSSPPTEDSTLPSLLQTMRGAGDPVAWQCRKADSPGLTDIRAGPSTSVIGSKTFTLNLCSLGT